MLIWQTLAFVSQVSAADWGQAETTYNLYEVLFKVHKVCQKQVGLHKNIKFTVFSTVCTVCCFFFSFVIFLIRKMGFSFSIAVFGKIY